MVQDATLERTEVIDDPSECECPMMLHNRVVEETVDVISHPLCSVNRDDVLRESNASGDALL